MIYFLGVVKNCYKSLYHKIVLYIYLFFILDIYISQKWKYCLCNLIGTDGTLLVRQSCIQAAQESKAGQVQIPNQALNFFKFTYCPEMNIMPIIGHLTHQLELL